MLRIEAGLAEDKASAFPHPVSADSKLLGYLWTLVQGRRIHSGTEKGHGSRVSELRVEDLSPPSQGAISVKEGPPHLGGRGGGRPRAGPPLLSASLLHPWESGALWPSAGSVVCAGCREGGLPCVGLWHRKTQRDKERCLQQSVAGRGSAEGWDWGCGGNRSSAGLAGAHGRGGVHPTLGFMFQNPSLALSPLPGKLGTFPETTARSPDHVRSPRLGWGPFTPVFTHSWVSPMNRTGGWLVPALMTLQGCL